jgi:hypothetical protein
LLILIIDIPEGGGQVEYLVKSLFEDQRLLGVQFGRVEILLIVDLNGPDELTAIVFVASGMGFVFADHVDGFVDAVLKLGPVG